MKKYELIKEDTIMIGDSTLYRIRALRDFAHIEAGELGGYIQKEVNLNHEGDAWVGGYARVYGDAWVFGNAQVYGDATVYENAKVSGKAQVYGNAWVCGDAMVYGKAMVYGDARVCGHARVSKGIITSGEVTE